jgi:hypothetical protein
LPPQADNKKREIEKNNPVVIFMCVCYAIGKTIGIKIMDNCKLLDVRCLCFLPEKICYVQAALILDKRES